MIRIAANKVVLVLPILLKTCCLVDLLLVLFLVIDAETCLCTRAHPYAICKGTQTPLQNWTVRFANRINWFGRGRPVNARSAGTSPCVTLASADQVGYLLMPCH